LLGNSNYYSHGANQPGDVVFINDRDVSTAGLPQRWGFEDEWYNLVPFPNNVNFLAVVDEATLPEGPARSDGHPGHGDFHPVVWCQYYDGGRAWITTLGHNRDSFYDPASPDAGPGAAEFQTMLTNGVKSAMGLEPFCIPSPGNSGSAGRP
jgi:type 1 glutamine amidotransferase